MSISRIPSGIRRACRGPRSTTRTTTRVSNGSRRAGTLATYSAMRSRFDPPEASTQRQFLVSSVESSEASLHFSHGGLELRVRVLPQVHEHLVVVRRIGTVATRLVQLAE